MPLSSCSSSNSNEDSSGSSLNEHDSSSESSNGDSSSSSSSNEELILNTYEEVSSRLADSKPTKIKSEMTYTYPQGRFYVELHSSSELLIEYGNDNHIKAKYHFSKEVLNDSLDGDFKKTEEGDYYIQDDEVGILKDGSVDWGCTISNPFTLSSFNFKESNFDESSVSFANDYFIGNVKSGKEGDFLGSVDLEDQISSLTLKIGFGSSTKKVRSLYSTFVTSEKASAQVDASYSYSSITVRIPN